MSIVRILIADDFDPWAKYISTIISSIPDLQLVSVAHDGLSAVQQAAAIEPDLILLDINLPSLSGIEVARRIKQLVPSPQILFVSQNVDPLIVRAAFDAGGSGYVVKIDISELPEAIRTVRERGAYFSRTLRTLGLSDMKART
jgi:two-component system response regulator NreC